MILQLLNISSVLLNAKMMNRSRCIDNCGFFRHLPREDFLANFETTETRIKLAPIIQKLLLKLSQGAQWVDKGKSEMDLTVHVDATYDFEIENFTWTDENPIPQRN